MLHRSSNILSWRCETLLDIVPSIIMSSTKFPGVKDIEYASQIKKKGQEIPWKWVIIKKKKSFMHISAVIYVGALF